jgi:regulator of sirC expression with transglutaminase-like and TPR domain
VDNDPGALVEVLRHGAAVERRDLARRLREDPDLLGRVHIAAGETPPQMLNDLLLEADASELVDRFVDTTDLESGLWLLPCLERPRHDHETSGRKALDDFAERLRNEVGDAGALARALGENYGFGGDSQDYHHPRNCFLDQVLERRAGLPLTLVALWLLLARRIGFDAWAVALPGHVVGGWPGGWVDPYAGGAQVSRGRLDELAKAAGAENASPWLEPPTDVRLLQRMALNCSVGYRRRGDLLRSLVATALARNR